jgi:aminopeptidase-like protein
MHRWASDLFPICRSLTGNGVRETLSYLGKLMPELRVHEVESGTHVLDWIVPDEWNVRDAYIADAQGVRIVDFRENNLHLVGYSEPVDAEMGIDDLEPHLHSLPDRPEAIPFVTSYYKRDWGFCLSQHQRNRLGAGPFRVFVDSDLGPGSLTYADAVVPGDTPDEVLISTYVCHPSMANNELSGPVVAAALCRWVSSLPSRRYTYRFVFAPETIGAIVYLAHHLDHLREHVRAGWVLTCIGDDRAYSYLPSRLGGTLSDRVSLRVLEEIVGDFETYTFFDRGSDERQWCSPGAELPVCSVMRSKYATYPEYHTSLDDLELVTPGGLQGGLDVMRRCIELVEANRMWRSVTPGEPQLGRRGLYPATSFRGSISRRTKAMVDVLAFCDGGHDVLDLCERARSRSAEVLEAIETLSVAGLIVESTS